jgi:hypothetical protein
MISYPVQSIESAPENSKLSLKQLEQAFGFVPNLVGAIANSPVLTNSRPCRRGPQHDKEYSLPR